MKITTQDFEQMKEWLAYMVPKTFRPDLITPETDPVACLEQTETGSPSKAQIGLAMAIGDIIEMTEAWPINRVAETDDLLSSNGLPTLTEIRLRFSKSIRRAVKRGSIKNEVEYYAIRNAAELAQFSGEELWPLLSAYEARLQR